MTIEIGTELASLLGETFDGIGGLLCFYLIGRAIAFLIKNVESK
jgi:hypothetical protein